MDLGECNTDSKGKCEEMKVAVYYKDDGTPRGGLLKEIIDCSHAKFNRYGECLHNDECNDEAINMNDGWGFVPLECKKVQNSEGEPHSSGGNSE